MRGKTRARLIAAGLLTVWLSAPIGGTSPLAAVAGEIKLSKTDCDSDGNCVLRYERASSPTEPPSFWQQFLALFQVSVPAEKRPWGKSVAFLAGVAEYDHLEPQLPYVRSDVEDMRRFLLEEAGFDLVYVALDRIVSEALIRRYMLEKLPKELTDKDRLLFYYSGHGADRPGTNSGYMQFSSARPGVVSTGALRIRSCDEEWSGALPAKHVLFIFDACASGLGFEPKSGEASSQDVIASLSGGGSRHVMTAGTAEEKVYQVETAIREGHSVFTHALLEAFRTGFGVRRKDGFLLTSDLISGVKREVTAFNTRNPGRKMTPRLWPIPRPARRDPASGRTLRDDGDFVFLNPTAENPDLPDNYRNLLGVVPKAEVSAESLPEEAEYWKYVLAQKEHVPTGEYRNLLLGFLTRFPNGLLLDLANRELAAFATLELDSGVKIEFVEIGAGQFEMGPGRFEFGLLVGDLYDRPVRSVEITRGFQLGKHELTQSQWEAVMGPTPSKVKRSDLPVDSVSWGDVLGFLKRLNDRRDGWCYRLPTEAEWEYAARAGTKGDYSGHLSEQDNVAWHRNNSGGKANPVGRKEPNAWGLFDMLGNVWEWVGERYGVDDDLSLPNPDWGPEGLNRVIRGGGFTSYPSDCRWGRRVSLASYTGYVDVGFRLLRQSEQSAKSESLPASN